MLRRCKHITIDLIMSTTAILSLDQKQEWDEVLSQIGQYDFYHLASYHKVAEQNGEGEAILIMYREDEQKVGALPLLTRSVAEVPALSHSPFKDATSVYGYPGPIVSQAAQKDGSFFLRFQQAIDQIAQQLNIVSVFSRLNPILENQQFILELGEAVCLSNTVAIDLSIQEETQFAQYRKSHRYEVRRAKREGMVCYRDCEWVHFEKFIELYTVTMHRAEAARYYFFDQQYFSALRDALGDKLALFVAELEGNICSAALFVHNQDIVQYHLSGSDNAYRKLAPAKLIIDTAREWGNEIGAKFLHLGGGVGSQEDSLFQLKAGFSPNRHPFFIWKWIVQPNVYEELVAECRVLKQQLN